MKKRSILSLWLLLSLAGPAWSEEPPELFQHSYDSEATGKLADALSAMDRIPSPQKEGYTVKLRRAWLLYRLGRNDEAVEAYTKAIAVCPKAVEPRVGILLPELALRRWTDAETHAKGVLKLDPANYLATLRMAFSLFNLHRYDESVALYARLHQLYPSDVEVLAGLGWALFKQGQAAEAQKHFREVLDIAPQNTLARDGLKASGG